jgi:hypothetical protein
MLPLTLPEGLDTQVRKLSAPLDLGARLSSGLDLSEQVVHRLLLTTGWCAAMQKRASSGETAALWNRQLEMSR